MPRDPRTYANITHDFADSPKLQIVSVEARWAYLEMILYSCRMQTDGVLSKRLAAAKWSLDVCQELATNDDEKPSLLETEDAWIIHDFAEHQTTKAEIEARRKQKQEAGRKGGLARKGRSRHTKSKESSRLAGAKASAIAGASSLLQQPLKQTPSRSEAEVRNKKEGGNGSTDHGSAPIPDAESSPQSLDELAAAYAAPAYDPTRCADHQGLPADEVPNCWQCARARKATEEEHLHTGDAAKAARRAAIDACGLCDENGWRLIDGVAYKCDHHAQTRKAG